MNYLAHAYLSFGRSHVLAGNMISDFVKGKKQYEFDTSIQSGIKLHRAIDEFTDFHPAIKEMKKPFKAVYGLYAGALTDVACDYFLANDTNEFYNKEALASFTKVCYEDLQKQITSLPPQFQQYFSYMKKDDWLYNYRHEWLIQKSFVGMARKARYMDEGETAFRIFQDNKDYMQPLYNDFFPLLKKFSKTMLEKMESID